VLRVGLTGGIGCGKTHVAELFAALGVPVLDADAITRELQAPGQELYAAIVDHFGPAILDARGRLDRAALRCRIFDNPQERRALEALVHPAVRRTLEEQLARLPASTEYALIVVPLLFEAGWEGDFHHVITVHCDPEDQVDRVVRRDQRSPEEVAAIIAAQMAPAERRRRADSEICNPAGTPEEALRARVAELDSLLRQKARSAAR